MKKFEGNLKEITGGRNKEITCMRYGKAKSIILFIQESSSQHQAGLNHNKRRGMKQSTPSFPVYKSKTGHQFLTGSRSDRRHLACILYRAANNFLVKVCNSLK